MRTIALLCLLLVLSVGCTGPEGEEPPDTRARISTASVSAPGLSSAEASTAVGLSLLHGFDDQTAFAASTKGAARLYAPMDKNALDEQLGDAGSRLADGTSTPELTETDGSPAANRIEVRLNQIEMRKLKVRFEDVEESLTVFLEASDAPTPESLTRVQVGQAPAGPVLLEHVADVATDSPAERTTWTSVAAITGATMDEVRFRMERLEEGLGESETTVIPQLKSELEVRLTREAILNQVVHFPELQEALLPYADRSRVVGDTDPIVVLLQTPRPYEEASKAIVTSNSTGDDLPITMVAEVQVVDRPEAIVRIPGNHFVGFVLVRDMPAGELAWQAWQTASRPAFVENWSQLPTTVRALLHDILMERPH